MNAARPTASLRPSAVRCGACKDATPTRVASTCSAVMSEKPTIHLGRSANAPPWQLVTEAQRPVSAAGSDDGADVVGAQRLLELEAPPLVVTGQVAGP